MSYKERFNASEGRALSQIVATKILRDLTELRSKVQNSPTAPRRWVWELIQNAKDVHHEGGVKIQIEFGTANANPYVKFSHNGKPFTADNIRFLIEQISTKDRTKDEEGKRKSTGKFGTGFLSTHLLSEIVTIEAVAKEPDLDYRKFVLKLDRTGYEPNEITDAVQIAKRSVEDLDTRPPYLDYVEGEFNTVFNYPLQDEINIKVATEGAADVENCLPYALVFVPEIESVETLPDNRLYKSKGVVKKFTDTIQVVTVSISGQPSFHAVRLTKGYTDILMPIKKEGESIGIAEIASSVPRLFCDFPLIGTEKFPFPVIINNPHFNPTDPRDGVFLTNAQRPQIEENKAIVRDAVELYFELLEYASENGWKNLHLLAQLHSLPSTMDWVDGAWFKKDVLDPIRNQLLYTPIVYTSDNELASILVEGNNNTWFPAASKKEIRELIWNSYHSWAPERLPQHSDIELWNNISWSECGRLTVTKLAQFVSFAQTLESLSWELGDTDGIKWLNDLYKLIALEEKEYDAIINKLAIFPNQNGDLRLKADLYKDAGNIGDEFKDILSLLGNDIRSVLTDERIEVEFSAERTMDETTVVKEINSEVNEKSNNREVAKSYMPAFKKLLLWFSDNTSLADKLFPVILKQKHLLYDDADIMANITKSNRLDQLMKKYDINDIDGLEDLLEKRKSGNGDLLPVTQEILASMGIQSATEWAEAIKDKNLQELFKHDSIPTTDMFLFVQSMITQAKASIIAFLDAHDDYDVSDYEETAPTILAGILKLGQPVTVVVRPAYNGEVIIYYGSEQDVLDFDDRAELWVDTGSEVKKITLGHILKTGQIRKFPI